MKKLILISSAIILYNLSFAQIKMDSYGRVGIGESNPSNKLHVKGSTAYFKHATNPNVRPMQLVLMALDPRISSENKIVFYKIDGTGTIDIQCKSVILSSDSTEKENIRPITDQSLEKIQELQGIIFNWKSDELKKDHAGFIAQDVEKIIPEIVSTVDSSGKKSITYSGLLPYIVEAIKEQQSQIEMLQSEILQLKNSDAKLKGTQEVDFTPANVSILYQNSPNPFSENTQIEYYLAEDVNSAIIYIYDMNGTQLKSITLHQKGYGNIKINSNELQAGMYMYTLIANKKEIDTKRMILTR